MCLKVTDKSLSKCLESKRRRKPRLSIRKCHVLGNVPKCLKPSKMIASAVFRATSEVTNVATLTGEHLTNGGRSKQFYGLAIGSAIADFERTVLAVIFQSVHGNLIARESKLIRLINVRSSNHFFPWCSTVRIPEVCDGKTPAQMGAKGR